MELWLDTIDTVMIQEASAAGILTGVTTNPTILSQTQVSPDDTLQTLLDCQSGWVAAQVTAMTVEDMLKQARLLHSISSRFIIKIPLTLTGLQVISTLTKENIPTMATAIFEPTQVWLAAKAGARYAAPYLSRVEELTKNGLGILADMQAMISQQCYQTKINAASITSIEQLVACAKLGIAAITLPKEIYKLLMTTSSATENSLKKFSDNWLANVNMAKSEIFI